MKESTLKILARISIVVATMIWGSMFVVSKNTLETVPVYFMTAARYTVASVLLALMFRKRLKGKFVKALKPGIIGGVLMFAGSVLQMEGLKYSTPGKTAFLTVVYCVLVPFVYWMVYKKRPSAWNVFAAFLCLFGIGLLSLGNDFSIAIGDLLVLMSGVIFAFHIVVVSVYVKVCDTVAFTLWQFMLGGAIAWVFHFFTWTVPLALPGETIISLAYLAIFPTCLAILLQNFSQQHIEPSAAALLLCLESVFGVIFSVLFYGEVLTARMVSGFVLIFASIVLSETRLSFLRPSAGSDDRG